MGQRQHRSSRVQICRAGVLAAAGGLALLVAWRLWLAPGDALAYVRGSFLPTVATAALLAAMAGLARWPMLWGLLAAAAALMAVALGNQLLLWAAALLGTQLQLAHQAPLWLAALVLGLAGVACASRGTRAPLHGCAARNRLWLAGLWQALFGATLLAFLMKLESHFSARPFAMPAALLTLVVPALFMALISIWWLACRLISRE